MPTPQQTTKEKKKPEEFIGVVSFAEFKNAMGEAANKYTDEEIERRRIIADRTADMFFEQWLSERNQDIVLDKENYHDIH